jgi:hypothetical protein
VDRVIPGILHLHTYFFFPFSIDKAAVLEEHGAVWASRQHWIDGLDDWLAEHQKAPALKALGGWRRAAYTRFDMESVAYQDMVFFHPFVRRVFFDVSDSSAQGADALLRCYAMPVPKGKKLWFEAEDRKGRRARVEVTDLRLFLFANGIGILSIGVEAFHISASDALWINEALRKVYPSSGRQIRESRVPCRFALVVEGRDYTEILAEERFETGEMKGFLPPLSKTITSLLYFADYTRQEFEPVLDERMIVYTYFAIDPATVLPDYVHSEDYQILLSRFLYVDRLGEDYRYNPEFVRRQMAAQLYTRWAHQGTYFGCTSYSNITGTIGAFDCDEHLLREGFLIHRMFDTRYYLMSLVALFYRATLLMFAERTALVAKRLYMDQEDGNLSLENLRLANDLATEFLHFSNYWHFEELANKDEEIEHFELQCREYRIASMRAEVEQEIEKMNASLNNYYQFHSNEAVNRLAVVSLVMGAGAVLTGFFGMNFGRAFGEWVFSPERVSPALHYSLLIAVTLLAFGGLLFGTWVIASHWQDYRDTLRRSSKRPRIGGAPRHVLDELDSAVAERTAPRD